MSVLFKRLLKGLIRGYKSGVNKTLTKEKIKNMCDVHHSKGFITDKEYEELLALIGDSEDKQES